MFLKPGVKISGISPEIVLAAIIVESAMPGDAVITSCLDGQHDPNSKHYTGHAIDIRSKDLSGPEKDAMLAALQQRLGAEFVVILEGRGTENEHFHCQHGHKEAPDGAPSV